MSITVAIAAYMFDLEHDEFMIRSLAKQTCQDFDLLFIDPYKNTERELLVRRMCTDLGIDYTYFPYELPPMPRKFDWAIWNTPFLFTDKKRVFRYQQWRVIHTRLIEYVLSTPGNIGLLREHAPTTAHVQFADHIAKSEGNDPGSSCGDWCITVEDFLEINGIDEVGTALCHYEDTDMLMRWQIAYINGAVNGFTYFHGAAFRIDDVSRSPGRDPHPTVPDARQFDRKYKFGRREIPGWQDNCSGCAKAFQKLNDGELDGITELAFRLSESSGQIWWQCKNCDGVFHEQSHPHFKQIERNMRQGNFYHATMEVGDPPRYGRDLVHVRGLAQGKSVQEKIEIINNSWDLSDY